MKYLSTILAFANIGVHYYLKELNIVKDELESGEKEFKNVNKKWYWGQLTFLHYLLAKANLYLSKDSEMKDNINQSLNYAQKSNDIASEVRARAYLYIYTNCPEKCKNEFNNSLEKLKKKNVISYPFVKKLINPINLHEFELESKKKTGNLHTVLRRIGV